MIKRRNTFCGIILCLLLFACGCQVHNAQAVGSESANAQGTSNELVIYYIDVGQGDACLVEYNNHFMLIDAGDNDDETLMVDFLKEKKVKTLDYVFGTHPHADHIGGLDAVINNFDIKKLYMPKVVENTKTFEDVLTAIESNNLKVNSPEVGKTMYLDNVQIQILAPIKQYEEMNDNSIVLKISYQNFNCLFTGDMQSESEQDVLSINTNIKSDVLKVAHHGSNSSSTEQFIDAVEPEYAIISVGKDNTYGHPTPEVVSLLKEKNIKIFRTDVDGTVMLTTNGKDIQISSQYNKAISQADAQRKPEPTLITYIGNKNSQKFHIPTCTTLPAEQNRVEFTSREEALSANYIPCKKCKP